MRCGSSCAALEREPNNRGQGFAVVADGGWNEVGGRPTAARSSRRGAARAAREQPIEIQIGDAV
jgi:hypothetical protein